ncbi:MAG: GTPase ObgE [Deltaproteobacteria bacterium]|nr:GTPase ObgE [Deltaproteobacteria bacterium]
MKSFPDEAEITVRGGAGGAGCVSFLRAAHRPQGRPDGGDGGAGGDVILEAAAGTRTLRLFKRRKIFQADKGGRGQSQDRHGKNGPPLIIPVPLGTLVYHPETRELLGELLTPGARLLAAKGGRGGKGNAHFVSSRLRSPRFAQPGEPGEERRLRLELQILADVGLVGAPNAGKTTLLKALTASRARVGAFPFTTLSPQLGALTGEVQQEPLILAEIPGLIPGAHLGKGLGHRFLRHIKRTRLMVMVIDLSGVDPQQPLAPLKALEVEMDAFDPELSSRPRLVILNKTDLLPGDFPREAMVRAYEDAGWRVFPVSAKTGEGVSDLRAALWEKAARLETQPDTD